MRLSKYVLRIPMESNNNVIYFNRANGSIILLSESADKLVLGGQYEKMVSEEFTNLKKCKMLIEVEEPLPCSPPCKTFQITIEMSSLCNLHCTYCYENDKGTRKEIDNQTLDKIMTYIRKVLQQPEIESVCVGFIGGEPLLHKKKVMEAIEKVEEICSLEKKKYHIHIDTNGTIEFADILKNYSNVTIAITLSSHRDHILNRPSEEFDSFERVISNISMCDPSLENKGNEVVLRYNTHSENIDEFETFVQMVCEKLPICRTLEHMYTEIYDYNKGFHSTLTKEEFAIWNATKAIDILIKYNLPIEYSINSTLSTCIAYKPYSCKIYADGTVTICDSMFHSQGFFSIDDMYCEPQKLNELFKDYKNYDPLKDIKCKECKDVVLCMGHLLCREDCDFQIRFSIKEFILSYVKYVLQGKGQLFINM